MLIGAAVQNAAGRGVPLEPVASAFELAATLHGAYTTSGPGVLGHPTHLLPESHHRGFGWGGDALSPSSRDSIHSGKPTASSTLLAKSVDEKVGLVTHETGA